MMLIITTTTGKSNRRQREMSLTSITSDHALTIQTADQQFFANVLLTSGYRPMNV